MKLKAPAAIVRSAIGAPTVGWLLLDQSRGVEPIRGEENPRFAEETFMIEIGELITDGSTSAIARKAGSGSGVASIFAVAAGGLAEASETFCNTASCGLLENRWQNGLFRLGLASAPGEHLPQTFESAFKRNSGRCAPTSLG